MKLGAPHRAILGLSLALLFGSVLASFTLSPEQEFRETRTYRVTLKNGQVFDARGLREAPQTVVLFLESGEIVLQRKEIRRIEVLKSRPAPPTPAPPPKVVKPAPTRSPAAPDPAAVMRIDAVLAEYPEATDLRRYQLLGDLVRLAPSAIPYLVLRLETAEDPLRALLAAALHECPSSEVYPALERLLKHPEDRNRIDAVRLVGSMRASWMMGLLPLLGDPSPKVRVAVVEGLALSESTDAFRALGPACGDAEREVRLAALHALPAMADRLRCPENLDAPLLEAYDRTRGEARADVIVVMGISGRRPLAPYLGDALHDESPLVRSAAIAALLRMGGQDWHEQILLRFLRERDDSVRIALATAARTLKLQPMIEPLIDWLRSSDPELVDAAWRGLTAITEQDFGREPDRWSAWWASKKPR